jgi:TIR domain-containing protein
MASADDIWQPRFETGRFFRLFISHTSRHKREVALLSSALSAYGIAGFVAHDSISPTEAWQDVILRALGECEALAAYLTDDFPNSEWTDQEVGAAVIRDVVILPLRVGINPYGFIGRIQAMPADGIDLGVLAMLIAEALGRHPRTRAAMAEAVVDRFVRSYSFDNARENFARLQKVPAEAWTLDLALSVRHALVDNEQLRLTFVGEQTLTSRVFDLLHSLSPPLW